MANYTSSRTGFAHDGDEDRLTSLENKLIILENLTTNNNFTGIWNISISGKASYIEATDNAINPEGALLRSSSSRSDSSPDGDTWIFYDEKGGPNSYWGIRHNQGANTIGFYGSGTERVTISMGESKITAAVFAGTATQADKLMYQSTKTSTDLMNAFQTADGIQVAKFQNNTISGIVSNDGIVLQGAWSDKYGFQFVWDDQGTTGAMAVRQKDNGNWQSWKTVTTSGSSSIKIKENIKNLTNDEAYKILQLNPISFDYKSKYDNAKNQYGFIAEQIEAIIPYAIEKLYFDNIDGDPIKIVNFNNLIPFIVKLAQIQQEEINTLKQKVEQLEQVINNGNLV